MNKRKTNISTVVEAVPHGFEADGYTVVSHETVEGKADNRRGPGPGALGPKLTAPTTTSRTLADWAKDHPHTWLEATGPNEAIDGPKSGPNTGQGPEVTANRGSTTPPAARFLGKVRELHGSFPARTAKSMDTPPHNVRNRCRQDRCSNKWILRLGNRRGSTTPTQPERRIRRNDEMRWRRPGKQKIPSTGSPCVAPPKIAQR